jgi:hypothetical protein
LRATLLWHFVAEVLVGCMSAIDRACASRVGNADGGLEFLREGIGRAERRDFLF